MTETTQTCFLRCMNKATIGSPLDTTFPPLENVIEEQSSNNELSMVQETTNNRLNDPSMTADKSVKKLPSSTDPADNNFVSFDADNCINNFRTSEKKEKKNSKENIAITSEIYKKIINCRRLHCWKHRPI